MAREAYSELMKAVAAGKFVFTSEVAPKKTIQFDDAVSSAKALKDYVVACNVTDNLRAMAYLNSIVASHIIQERAGVEAVCQMTVRDRNRLALTSDLLGAAALGIKNILSDEDGHTKDHKNQ